MGKEASTDSSQIKTLSWLKYLQSVLLLAVGFAFAFFNLSLFDNPSEVFRGICFVLGILFAIYGTLSSISGYIVDKTPFSQNVIFGLFFISLAFIFLLKPNVIYEIATVITIAALFAFATLFTFHAFYLIFSKKKRKKKGLLITLSFFGVAFCLVLVFLYFFADINFPERYNNGIDGGERMIGIILGPSIILIGIVSFLVTVKRAKNTKILFADSIRENDAKTKKAPESPKYDSSKDFSSYAKTNVHPNNNKPPYTYASSKRDTFASSFGFSSTKQESQPKNENQSKQQEKEPEVIDIRPKN